MKIAKNTVVSVAYKLSDAQGNLIEESDEPMVYLHGGYDGTFPKIEDNSTARSPAIRRKSSWSRRMRSAITILNS
ncbi:putative peptidyl-prolyl cis-trans isomerase [Burkholderia mallei NCTC 10247]|nr:fkbp-type peptidyl-prolyl cis-trans isomerase 2 [Burkholderia mallei SAVP1]AIO53150.1 putative peptidyl-prolyl cis-trans isomerase [Burkholderia mallei]AIS27848.1 putative peptidyl-prolyl cis-trans isomerase [Burkholderia mallei NCTC 10247]AIO58891.1 putative peptidyl-prolyl cis-trans isomerase [Burkholderia mallei]AIO63566.1 putative peptidyl-prolyl cis-trans isomerase [Burkholderia mallei]